jgi:hypothetical protein
VDKFMARYSQGEDFEVTEYGKILLSGWGRPDSEVVDKMRAEYGVETPVLEVI